MDLDLEDILLRETNYKDKLELYQTHTNDEIVIIMRFPTIEE